MYLLIVSGMSGSGKSAALKILEDDGFYCVDNLPLALLSEFISKSRQMYENVELVAVAVDAREYTLHHHDHIDLSPLSELQSMGVEYNILYLDCTDTVLMRRYNATRRQHPMRMTVADGIAMEREFLSPLRDSANFILDTSEIKANELRQHLFSTINRFRPQSFSIIIQSFAYKNGAPFETDIVYDMRFINNPYYVEDLRELCGLDKPIQDFINKDPDVKLFMDKTEEQIRFLIPRYIRENKRRLMISFGCTGGRHRSVFGANDMYNRLKDDFQTTIIHRDLYK